MSWIAVTLIVIGAVALAALVGSRLPVSHRASGERLFPVPPEELWRTLTDIEGFLSWRHDLRNVERLPDRDGKPAWIEIGRAGRMTFIVERMEPPYRLVSRIADSGGPFGGTWTYQISTGPEGSRLRITEDGEIHNPVFRFVARFIFGYEGTMNAYFTALAARFERQRVDVSARSRG